MGASTGYGQAVHSGKCAMHKLGIQVLPSPDMMAIMDANGTLCKVTLLSIRSEDMLADYTADEFATGFKKRPAFQLRSIKQNRGSSCEGIWITKRQPGSSCPSPVVMVFMGSNDMLCRVAILNIGWEDTLAPFTIKECWLSSRTASSRAKACQARASGPPNGNLAAHALHPM